jgi:hypothetical protein
MLRLLLVALLLCTVFAAEAPAAVFDRPCDTRAEGGEPEDVALPDPGRPLGEWTAYPVVRRRLGIGVRCRG